MNVDFLAVVRDARPEDLPALLGALETARAAAWLRLRDETRPAKLLSVDEAAELLSAPRRRVFSLARSADWAVRVGRRLLVDEQRFRVWLVDVRGGRETT
jgi:hypothetical protein